MQNHSNETNGMEAVVQNAAGKDNYEFAGFWVRLAAYAMDTIVVSAALLIVRLVFLAVDSLLAGTFLEGGILFHYTLKDIILYLLQVLYFVLLTYHTGTTLGKRALNLRVIRSDGDEKLSLWNVIYRETIGRFLSGFVLFIGYLLIGIDKEKRGLHDILGDTRVIYAKRVKVYSVYQGKTDACNDNVENDYIPNMVDESTEEESVMMAEKQGMSKESLELAEQQDYANTEEQYVPRMVEELSMKGKSRELSYQDDIQAQWKRILNPQKKETNPQTEEQNIEGNP